MKPSKVLRTVTDGVDVTIRLLSVVACGLIAIMVLVVAINVVGRLLFNQPLLGTVELVELMMVIVVFFAMSYTAVKRGHVIVDLVTSRLSRRNRAILRSITFFLSAGIFAVITYRGSVNAMYYAHHPDQATTVLSVPFAFSTFVMAIGCLLLCLKLFLDVFHTLPPEEGQKGGLRE